MMMYDESTHVSTHAMRINESGAYFVGVYLQNTFEISVYGTVLPYDGINDITVAVNAGDNCDGTYDVYRIDMLVRTNTSDNRTIALHKVFLSPIMAIDIPTMLQIVASRVKIGTSHL
jgi:hypothetical protein